MKNIVICLILFIITSCNKGKEINSSKNNVQFTIYDSLKVNYPSLRYAGMTKNKILFSDRVGQKIVLFDYITNKTKVIDKHGGGPEQYRRIIYNNVTFLTDSLIVVSDILKYKKYDLNGNYNGVSQLDNKNTYAPTKFVKKINDSIVVLFKGIQGDPSTADFYKKKQNLFIVKNILNDSEQKTITFPLQNSDIVMKDSYLAYIYEHDVKYVGNSAFIINSNDEAIYKINLLQNTVERIKLNLEYYKPKKYKFGQTGDINEQIIDLYTSSIIGQINVSKNYIFIQYDKPYKRDYVFDYKRDNKIYPIKDVYLQILKNNKKIFKNDILLPREKFGSIVHIKSKDSMLVRKPSNENDENGTITTYYWAKMEGLPND